MWVNSSRDSEQRKMIHEKVECLFSHMTSVSDLKTLAKICDEARHLQDFPYVEEAASHHAWQILSSMSNLKLLKKMYDNLRYCHQMNCNISSRAIEIIKETKFAFQDLEDLISYKDTWEYCNVELFEELITQLLIDNLKEINDISTLILYWEESSRRSPELVENRISEIFSGMNSSDFISLIVKISPPKEFKDIFKKKAKEFITLLNK